MNIAVFLVCNETIKGSKQAFASVGLKGLSTINEFSRKYIELGQSLNIPIHEYDEDIEKCVHVACQKRHSNKQRYEQLKKKKEDSPGKKLRSEDELFSFHTNCYLYGKVVDIEMAKKFPQSIEFEFSRVMVINVKETIMKRCIERCEEQPDEWADAVSYRLACINDLPAEEAIYHRKCFQFFMSPSNLKRRKTKKRGRRTGSVDADKKTAFMSVINFLERNDDETIALDKLHKEMEKYSSEVYSKGHLQRQLIDYYGGRVSITSLKQQATIVTLTSNAKQLINEAHTYQKLTSD